MILNGFSELNFYELQISDLIKKIQLNQPFQMVKLCDGFWQRQVKIQNCLKNGYQYHQDWNEILTHIGLDFSFKIYTEILHGLKNFHKNPNLLVGISHEAYRNSEGIGAAPGISMEDIFIQYKELITAGSSVHQGFFWKEQILDGDFVKFIETIKSKHILTIGQESVRSFNDLCGFSRSQFFLIEHENVGPILDDFIVTLIEQIKIKKPEICLIQMGDLFAFVAICRLATLFPEITFIDLGQVLSLGSVAGFEDKGWYRAYPTLVANTINSLNPGWKNNPVAFKGSQYEVLDGSYRWFAFCNHITPHLKIDYKLLNSSEHKKITNQGVSSPIPQKNKGLIRSITSHSSSKRINFLESLMHSFLKLDVTYPLIYFEDVSQALKTILQSCKVLKSDNTAYLLSSALVTESSLLIQETLSALKYVNFVDCNHKGLPSLNEIQKISVNTWDTLFISNIFSVDSPLITYENFCAQNGKVLIIDHGYILPTSELIKTVPSAFHIIHSTYLDRSLTEKNIFVVPPCKKKEILKKDITVLKRSISYEELENLYNKIINFNQHYFLWRRQQARIKKILTKMNIVYLSYNNIFNECVPFLVCKLPLITPAPAHFPLQFQNFKPLVQMKPMANFLSREMKYFFFDVRILQFTMEQLNDFFFKLANLNSINHIGLDENTNVFNHLYLIKKSGKKQENTHWKEKAIQLIQHAEKNKLLPFSQIKKYCIVSTKRSGATLFCKILNQNNCGEPIQWFHPAYMKHVSHIMNWSSMNMEEYIKLVILGSTNPENKIFGLHLQADQFSHHEAQGNNLLQKIKFDHLYYVKRKDKFKQTYSYAKALKTCFWHREFEIKHGWGKGINIPVEKTEFLDAYYRLSIQFDVLKKMIDPQINRTVIYEEILESGFERILNNIQMDLGMNNSLPNLSLPLQKQSTPWDESQLKALKKNILEEIFNVYTDN